MWFRNKERQSGRLAWAKQHALLITLGDLAVLVLAFANRRLSNPDPFAYLVLHSPWGMFKLRYVVFSGILLAIWMLLLHFYNTRDSKIFESGITEYLRVIQASFTLYVMVALWVFIFQVPLTRSYVVVVFPLGTIGMLIMRRIWRRRLLGLRKKGKATTKTIIVGEVESIGAVLSELRNRADAGLDVERVVLYGANQKTHLASQKLQIADHLISTTKTVHDLVELINANDFGYIVIAEAKDLTAADIRELSWQLDPTDHELIFVPKLLDVRGPRLHARPVLNLQLIHMDLPSYPGARGSLKRLLDLTASTFGIIVLSPLMLITALAIKLSDGGPVFFTQTRVGLHGKEFKIYKFRSMRTDAEKIQKQLQAESRDAGNEVLFKMKDDPRVTRIGRFIRRHSIDELPQLFNVFIGTMSLVGPRPPLPREVEAYASHVHRRLLVKPGITGLWQVSGRSELSWEESIKLDLDYVENWSILVDLQILVRTIRVVIFGVGAY
jgi:exopolysaccharide biosynthesis polyprenyl glycosylphosphotransferase